MTNHPDLVEALRVLPDRVAEAASGMSDEELRRRPAEGEWCVKEVCGHLRDNAEIWVGRFHMMTTQTDPLLADHDPASVHEHNYPEQPIEDILSDLRRQVDESVSLLSDLARDHWKRTGRHATQGRLTVREGLELMLRHAEGHLEQIRALRPR